MEKQLKQTQNNRADLVKVVLFGPESTGKTILAKRLASHYKTVYVPEFSRAYAQQKLENKKELTKDDVLPIAIGQMENENAQQQHATNLLICDTDLLETKVYSEYYYDGFCPPEVEKFALENTYDLYFLTYIDTAWEADGLRDKPNERLPMFDAFELALKKTKKPYALLEGSYQKRFDEAVKHIDKLLKL